VSSIDHENLEALNNLAHAGTHYILAVFYEGEGNIKPANHFYQNFVALAFASHPTLSVQVKKHIKALR
jgi:hypothetical protein